MTTTTMTTTTAPSPNIFHQIQSMGQKTHRVGISLIDHEAVIRDKDLKATNLKELAENNVVFFDIITPTPLIEEQANAFTAKVNPKPKFETVPAEKQGKITRQVGYDYECPLFIEEMEKAEMNREIFICLSCCPQLGKDTTGNTIDEKIEALKAVAPRSFIASLFKRIADIGAHSASADFFLSSTESKDSPTSKDSKKKNSAQRTKK